MDKKQSLKYYLGTFSLVLIFMIIMCVMAHIQGTYVVSSSIKTSGVWSKEISVFFYKGKTFILGKYVIDIAATVLMPFVFCLIFFGIDKLSNLFKGKKKREQEKEEMKYENFIDDIGAELNRMKSFNAEDFRHFRENSKFQECLKKLYEIYKDGESEKVNYKLVLRKFEKNSNERKALESLIAFTEKRRLTKSEEKPEGDK